MKVRNRVAWGLLKVSYLSAKLANLIGVKEERREVEEASSVVGASLSDEARELMAERPMQGVGELDAEAFLKGSAKERFKDQW